MSNDEVCAKVIDEAGYNARNVLTRANSPEIKQSLRARTAEAKEVGICGVPTYRVFRRRAASNDQWQQIGDVVWGQDEVSVVEDLIAGSDGHSIASVDTRDERSSKL